MAHKIVPHISFVFLHGQRICCTKCSLCHKVIRKNIHLRFLLPSGLDNTDKSVDKIPYRKNERPRRHTPYSYYPPVPSFSNVRQCCSCNKVRLQVIKRIQTITMEIELLPQKFCTHRLRSKSIHSSPFSYLA